MSSFAQPVTVEPSKESGRKRSLPDAPASNPSVSADNGNEEKPDALVSGTDRPQKRSKRELSNNANDKDSKPTVFICGKPVLVAGFTSGKPVPVASGDAPAPKEKKGGRKNEPTPEEIAANAEIDQLQPVKSTTSMREVVSPSTRM